MRYLFCLILVGSCCSPTVARSKEILDTKKWPAALAASWQDQPTRHTVFFLEQPPEPEEGLPEPEPVRLAHPRQNPAEPSIFAGKSVGLVFLFGGLAGWFILAASVFVLERRAR